MEQFKIRLFNDAALLIHQRLNTATPICFFDDPVDAVAAATERVIFKSAFLPDLRKLEPFTVTVEMKDTQAPPHVKESFSRGLVRVGNRVLCRRCASYRPWIALP